MAQLVDGRYRLLERLGGGGMSVVWRAHDEVLGRQVAVKMLASEHAADATLRQRIRAEAQAAARVAHPYLTSVHDYGEAEDGSGHCAPYVVMELVDGPTLAERLLAGPVPPRTCMLVCAQVAAALAAAHSRGLVHRDIKPSNVMLSPSGAKVVDFGIAAFAGQPGESPATGELWGTPAYLAPERLNGGEVVPASDVYALGLLLYRLLAGAPPWHARTVGQMLRAHQYAEPAPLPPLPHVPAQVVALCRRCLSKQPAQRPTAAVVARTLAEASGYPVTVEPGSGDIVRVGLAGALAGPVDDDGGASGAPPDPGAEPAGEGGAAPPGEPGNAERRRRRRPRTAAVLVALVVLAVALAAGAYAGRDRSGGADGRGREAGRPAASSPGGPSTLGGADAGPPLATPPGGADRTVATPGGAVTCRCEGPTATLVSWEPLPTFTATEVDRGPAGVVGLVFRGVLTEVRVSLRCDRGEPVASIG